MNNLEHFKFALQHSVTLSRLQAAKGLFENWFPSKDPSPPEGGSG
jgi:hypothetical protein